MNRCDTCGKFRPWTDLKRVGYTPDSHRSSEDVERICSRCQCREREEQSAAQEAHDAALREQVRQANEKRDSFVQEVDGKADRIQRLWDEIAFDITNLRTQLATAEGEGDGT